MTTSPTPAQRLLAAPDLAALLSVIRSLPDDADIETERAMARLPTFGGEEPSDCTGVWSWDADSYLVGRGGNDTMDEMCIVPRARREEWPDWLRRQLPEGDAR